MSEAFNKFQNYLEQIKHYEQVITLLYWDMRTGTPKLGQEGHIDALTRFSSARFALSTSEELGGMLELLTQPEEYDVLDDMWKYVVTRMKRDFDRERRIPVKVYEAFVKAQAESSNAWEEAKKEDNFSVFAPHLTKMIAMKKEITSYTDPGAEVYDALLNQYEEGMDSKTIDCLFEEIKTELLPLVAEILAAEQPDDTAFHEHFDVDAQKKVQHMLLDYIGFRWEAGAEGEAEHPFTLNFSSKDVRVTNHYYEQDPLSAMFSAIHEGGHAVFEQNVNPAYDYTAAGSCRYMGIHESQSRFYENILGRSKEFWEPVYGKLGELLPPFQKISLEDFYREINHVRSSYIRTDADEVTYCFHVILRYELEKAIFRDGISVDELPALWNRKMQEYLHIEPRNDAEGILQDMHWSDGSFGYFPSYLLGSIYDGMFLEKIKQDLGPVDVILSDGKIGMITKWLNDNIHWYGSTRTPKEVINSVCGKEISAQPFVHYLKEKYKKVYGL